MQIAYQELLKLCVKMMPLPGNNTTETIFVHNLDTYQYTNAQGNLVTMDVGNTINDIDQFCRDVPKEYLRQPSYWTIHAIGAYEKTTSEDSDPDTELGGIYGSSYMVSNQQGLLAEGFMIFYETIRDECYYIQVYDNPGSPHIFPYIQSYQTVIGNTVLHEILHFFGCSDNTGGAMNDLFITDQNALLTNQHKQRIQQTLIMAPIS